MAHKLNQIQVRNDSFSYEFKHDYEWIENYWTLDLMVMK